MKKSMWEILVPTVVPNTNGENFFKTRFHKTWDERVRKITHGLTIMPPTKGQWVSPTGTLFVERMIPVRIVATHEEIHAVMDMTLEHYEQETVMCYRISDEVIFKTAKGVKNVS